MSNGNEIIRLLLSVKSTIDMAKIIGEIVEKDMQSQSKKDMQTSLNYFKNNNDILTTKLTNKNVKGSICEQYWRENIKISNNYLSQIVNEKVDYLLGKKPSITSENKQLIESMKINNSILQKTAEYTRIFGKAFWYVYVANNDINYQLLDTRELIPIYQMNKLVAMIRYYYIYENNEPILNVEYYDQNGYITFEKRNDALVPTSDYADEIDYETGIINISQETPYFKINNGIEEIPRVFSKLPFIEFNCNFTSTPDLEKIKQYIDNIDILLSDTAVDFKTFKDIYMIVSGFGGNFQDDKTRQDFFEYTRKYKTIISDSDGKADIKTVDIPFEAKKWFIDKLENIMYRISNSPRKQMEEKLGDLSGVALKILQNPLRQSVAKMATSIENGIIEWSNFVKEIKLLAGEVKITFNYNELTNDFETIQALMMSQGAISKKTLLENHPYVSDVEEELNRINEEINTETFGVETENDS